MEWKVIKTEKEYQKAIKRLDVIFDATKNSKEGDELELITLLIDKYEQEKDPIDFQDQLASLANEALKEFKNGKSSDKSW
jgi:HTH-type transcriptional regulator / antitoxin HigA